jgi:hypothetical protein
MLSKQSKKVKFSGQRVGERDDSAVLKQTNKKTG